MERLRQRVATHGNGFRLSEPFSAPSHLRPVAAGCARPAPQMLHPQSSVEAIRGQQQANLDHLAVSRRSLRCDLFEVMLIYSMSVSVDGRGAEAVRADLGITQAA